MKTYLLITLVFAMTITSFIVFAQAPAIDWQKSLGGTKGDTAVCSKQTPDGGYIVAGYSKSEDGDIFFNFGKNDVWVAKLDFSGNLQWNNTFGGSNDDEAYFISTTSDGGYIVAGLSYSNDGYVSGNHGDADYWIVKIDGIGNFQWQKSFGGTGFDKANSIEQTTDGGYIVAGYSQSNDGDVTGNHGGNDFWILKLDAGGNLDWQKSLGGSDNEKAYSVKQTSGGDYIIAGFSGSTDGDVTGNHGGFDYWVVQLNSSGDLQWQKSYGGSKSDIGAVLALDADGYVMTGQSRSTDGDVTNNNGGYDYWTIKFDLSGNLQWQKSYGGSGDDIAYSIAVTSQSGYILSGFSNSTDGDVTGNHGLDDAWVIKLHSDGSLNWQLSLGGSTTDGSSFIQQTVDGGYIVTSTSNSTDGDVSGNHGGFDYWLVKLDADLATSVAPLTVSNALPYPNPCKDFITFSQKIQKCEIRDQLGRQMHNFVFINSSINTGELFPGIYVADVIFADGSKVTVKIIKQ